MSCLSEKLVELVNYRIQEEEYSSRLYLSMSNWLNYNGYTGASKLWKKYSVEELEHAGAFYHYMLELDHLPVTPGLEQPPQSFLSLPDIIRLSYEHEKEVTMQIEELAKAAFEESNFMTLEIAQRYLREQVEELGKLNRWLDEMEAFGTSPEALRLMDSKMEEA